MSDSIQMYQKRRPFAVQGPRLCRFLTTGLVAMVALAGVSAQSMAQEANRVVSGCNFNLQAFRDSLTIAGNPFDDGSTPGTPNNNNLQAVAIVISANNPNFGQPILDNQGQPTGEYTGRVICMVEGVNGVLKAETAPIPEDPSSTIDIRDVGQGMSLRYQEPSNPGGIDANGIQLCATSNGNGDCVRATNLP